eukprot:gene9791-6868_t
MSNARVWHPAAAAAPRPSTPLPLFRHGGHGGGGPSLVPLLLLALALLCAVAAPTTLHVAGWSADYFNRYGPLSWSKYSSCPELHAETTEQFSPISFKEEEVNNALKGAGVCISRAFPFVAGTGLNGRVLYNKPASTAILDLNPGGVLRATCISNAPVFVNVWNCGPEGGETLIEDQLMEVIKIQFYNGPNHGLLLMDSNFFTPGKYYETEYFLKKADKKGTMETGEPFYSSVCHDVIIRKTSPDLIISLISTPASTQNAANSSITLNALGNLSHLSTFMKTNGAYYDAISIEIPLLPLFATTTVQKPVKYFYYEGSLVEPPCTEKIPRLVIETVIQYPTTLINVLNASSGSIWNGGGSITRNTLSSTKIYAGSLYQLENSRAPDETTAEPTKKDAEVMEKYTMDDRVLGLAITCILLFGVLLILLFSRYALVEFLPVGFGGLNYRMEWFRRSYEKAEELKALKDHDDFLAAAHQRQLREASGEVPPSSHRRRHRHAADSSTSSDASSFGRKEELSSHSPSTQQLIGSAAPATEDPVHLYSPTGPGTTGGGGLVTFQNTAQLYDHSGEKRMGAKAAQPSAAPAAAMDDGVDFQSLMSGVDKSRCL